MPDLFPVPQINEIAQPSRVVSQRWFDWFNVLRAIVLVLQARVRTGTGAPGGVVVGSVGDLWLRSDGGAGSTLYVKESWTNTTAGWAAK